MNTDQTQPPGGYYITPSDGFEGIQNVIDRTGGNVVIHLAPGEYVGSDLTLASGVMLLGSGTNATTIKLEDGADTDLITTPDPVEHNVMGCTLQNITFDGNRENNTAGNIVYGAFWNGRFTDCRFIDAPESGFWLAGSKESTDDNYFNGCRFIHNAGVGLRGGANKESYPAVGVVRVDINWFGRNDGPAIVARGNSWKITNSKLYYNATEQGASIELDRCSYASISGCDSFVDRPERDHVAVIATKGVNSIGNQIKDNDFRGDYRAAVRCRAASNDVTALQVHGNTIQKENNTGSGLNARTEQGGAFTNCSFKDNVFAGAPVDASPTNTLPAGWVSAGNLTTG